MILTLVIIALTGWIMAIVCAVLGFRLILLLDKVETDARVAMEAAKQDTLKHMRKTAKLQQDIQVADMVQVDVAKITEGGYYG